MYRLFTSHVAGLLMLATIAGPAAAINFIDNCQGQSASAAGTWHGTCPPYDNSQNNWEGNILPGPSDTAFIGAEYGMVTVNGPASETTVLSVQAMGGLSLEYSGYGIRKLPFQVDISKVEFSAS